MVPLGPNRAIAGRARSPAPRGTRCGGREDEPSGAIPFGKGLVRSAQSGNRTAFERLWSVHLPAVHAVVASLLPRDLVDDALQEVALHALASLPRLRTEQGFPAWLCAIARNRSRTLYARARGGGVNAELDGLPAVDRAPSGLEVEEALAALRALPATYREPLALRLLGERSPAEIARRLGTTPGTVRVTLCRGLKLLRERLGV